MGHLHGDTGQLVLGWQGRFWITDPGYQQYRAGDERIYSIGPEAHNPPVIGGIAQKPRAGVIQTLAPSGAGTQFATAVDLSACYEKLPKGTQVRREVWLATGEGRGVVVRDTFAGLAPATEIATHWQGGAHLAWAFVDGWARLSDGQRALWIGSPGESIVPADLTRHMGSRGPLTLKHTSQLRAGSGARWWVFWCDPAGSWAPPRTAVSGSRLEIHTSAPAPLIFGAENK
jgi:hypothetical protein